MVHALARLPGQYRPSYVHGVIASLTATCSGDKDSAACPPKRAMLPLWLDTHILGFRALSKRSRLILGLNGVELHGCTQIFTIQVNDTVESLWPVIFAAHAKSREIVRVRVGAMEHIDLLPSNHSRTCDHVQRCTVPSIVFIKLSSCWDSNEI